MTKTSSKLDSKSFGSRAKELLSISGFTIFAALICTALMDIIVFPLTMFAVKDVPSYNNLIKLIFTLFTGGVIIYAVVSTVKPLKMDNRSNGFIIRYIFKRMLHYMLLFLFFIAVCSMLIAVIYFLFSKNYYFMHRLGGGM